MYFHHLPHIFEYNIILAIAKGNENITSLMIAKHSGRSTCIQINITFVLETFVQILNIPEKAEVL